MKLYKGAISPANEITSGDNIDWQVDYYSGVVFIQDYNASTIPVSASAYLYTGKYLNAKISTVGDVSYGRTNVAGNYTATTNDKILGVNAGGALQITLPAASGFSAGQFFTIKDEAGNANTHNITISASSGDRIDGQGTIILESPYSAVNIYSNGTNKFFIY